MTGARRVIVGASGTPASLRALRYAEEAARRHDALLIPVLVWSPPGGELAERRTPSFGLRRIWEEAATERLTHALDEAWGALPCGVTVRPTVIRGEPGHSLVATANLPDDLLVIGAGRRGVTAQLWGARVSRYCLRHARCPVLAVPPATLEGSGHGLRGWAFRHRELTLDRAMRDWRTHA